MSRTEHYTMRWIESFPTPMEPGVVYVSLTYSTAGHICPCGCGREVVTKLSPARYKIIFDGEISLKPSVAASGLPCNSHYFITRGEVVWHAKLGSAQKKRTQASDRRALEADRTPTQRVRPKWRARLWRHVKN